MQQTKKRGGIALRNIMLCYQASLLEVTVQWWNEDNREAWEWEQDEISVLLTEWVLCARDHPSIQAQNPILYALSKFWKKMQAILSPGI